MFKNNDYWIYSREHGFMAVINVIDNRRMLQGESIEYLMKEKNMTQEESLRYINDLKHC